MPTTMDMILGDLARGAMTLEAACKQILSATRADPARTRFWNQRIETAMKTGEVTRAAARTLLDALEGFQPDKTVWIDGGLMFPVARNAASAPASSRAPEPAAGPSPEVIRNVDQLLPALIGRTWHTPAPPTVSGPPTMPVEWFDSTPTDTTATHPANPDNIARGTVIKDRYRIIEHLGAGGIGQVFDAIDLHSASERHVTLKVAAVDLRHQRHAFDALAAAVRRTQHLVHPNIVSIYEVDRHANRAFIVMEPLRGRWLSSLVRGVRGSGMPQGVAWPIIAGIANGLAFAHESGVVHSDLSPHAIFLGDDGTAKIMGFGLVHAVPTSNELLDVLDTLTLRAYTEAYAADPWSQLAPPHAADDLYPLGVIAYEMLTGAHPFGRCSLAIARQKRLAFAPIVGLNRRARKLIEHCLSFERHVRPQDAACFVRRMQPGMLERLLPASAS
jgi:tRNA A-37 threonylcarbamoyl transferase component Bud32